MPPVIRISRALISVTCRVTPSPSSYERYWISPSTYTRSPFERNCSAISASRSTGTRIDDGSAYAVARSSNASFFASIAPFAPAYPARRSTGGSESSQPAITFVKQGKTYTFENVPYHTIRVRNVAGFTRDTGLVRFSAKVDPPIGHERLRVDAAAAAG